MTTEELREKLLFKTKALIFPVNQNLTVLSARHFKRAIL